MIHSITLRHGDQTAAKEATMAKLKKRYGIIQGINIYNSEVITIITVIHIHISCNLCSTTGLYM